MTRYVAFLRGVSPMNCKMPQLRRCFEAAGFTEVKTLLSSGNVAFSARSPSIPALQKKAQKAMGVHLDRVFQTIVRPAAHLQALIDADPFAPFALPKHAKPVITFLPRAYEGSIELPVSRDQASILKIDGAEVFSAYVPNDKGPVFMSLLERTFGSGITTRTLDTVRKCAVA